MKDTVQDLCPDVGVLCFPVQRSNYYPQMPQIKSSVLLHVKKGSSVWTVNAYKVWVHFTNTSTGWRDVRPQKCLVMTDSVLVQHGWTHTESFFPSSGPVCVQRQSECLAQVSALPPWSTEPCSWGDVPLLGRTCVWGAGLHPLAVCF